MAWWIILYLALYTTFSAAGLWDDYRDRRPLWFLGIAVLSNLTIIYLFVAYWYPALRAPLGVVAPAAFVTAMCWELFQAIAEDTRGAATALGLSERERRVDTAIAYVGVAVLCLPAFVVAGIAAFSS